MMDGKDLLKTPQATGRNLLAAPSAEEPVVYHEPTAGEKAKAFGYGAVTGLAGSLGELEKFGAYDVPEFLGLREKGERDKFAGRETIFPTTEEIRKGVKKLGIERPREEVRGYETGGEIIGGLGTALPGIVKGGTKALLGVPSRTSEAAARQAERLGFKLSPAQVRQDVPASARGATGFAAENQTLANQLASKGTGKEAKEINPAFIRERLKTIGGEFDKLYKGKQFNIDLEAVQAIDALRQIETMLPGAAQVTAIKNTANNIIEGFGRMAARPGAVPQTFAIDGSALQTIRNDLSAAARSTSNRGDAHRIYELIDIIDGSVARNHPEIAAKLDVIRPQYRNSIVLEDLTRRGGIRQGNISLENLGDMLGQSKTGVRRGAASELDQLGELGRELRLRARWQEVGRAETPSADILQRALGTTMGKVADIAGLRTRAARRGQKYLAGKPVTPLERAGMVTGAGAGVTPLTDTNE